MAVREMARRSLEPSETGPHLPVWAEAERSATLPIETDRVRRLVEDVPAWPLWQSHIVRAIAIEGPVGRPGTLYRLTVGKPSFSVDVVAMLVGHSNGQWIYGGGRGRWRFVEKFSLSLRPEGTLVRRWIAIRLPPRLWFLRRYVTRMAAHHMEAAIDRLAGTPGSVSPR